MIFGLIFGLGYLGITIVTSGNNNGQLGNSVPLWNQSSSSSAQGVVLDVRVNSTTLSPGQELGISVDLINNLTSANSITLASNINASTYLTAFPIAMWAPCLSPELAYFMVVRGDYNLTQLLALSANSASPSILCMEGGTVESITFEPRSDVANLSGDFCTANCFPYGLNSTRLYSNFTINGYWAYPLNNSEAGDILTPPLNSTCTPNCLTFNYPEVGPKAQSLFGVGKYTLVVDDVFGQSVLLHFVVIPSSYSSGQGLTIGSVTFGDSWHYVGNVALSGSESSCEIMHLPCPSSPQNTAEELEATNGTTAFVETMTICGEACTTTTIVLTGNQIPYCVSPEFPSYNTCPQRLG